jgi:hypothetical protein
VKYKEDYQRRRKEYIDLATESDRRTADLSARLRYTEEAAGEARREKDVHESELGAAKSLRTRSEEDYQGEVRRIYEQVRDAGTAEEEAIGRERRQAEWRARQSASVESEIRQRAVADFLSRVTTLPRRRQLETSARPSGDLFRPPRARDPFRTPRARDPFVNPRPGPPR